MVKPSLHISRAVDVLERVEFLLFFLWTRNPAEDAAMYRLT